MVTRSIRTGFLAVALAAAVFVPSASASGAHRVKLSLVPLPKSALGAAGKSLALTHDSGVVSNASAASNSSSGTASTFKKLGRVTGYDLTYGDPFTGRTGITQIATGIEQYKTAAGARKGLAFWRKDDAQITLLQQYGIAVVLKPVKAPWVGTSRFGYATTLSFPSAAPIVIVDEQVADGKYVLDVGVAGGSVSAASHLASKQLRALDKRLQLAETGHLRSKPVKLLPPLKAGPPSVGPELSTLALTPSDLTGAVTVADHAYYVDSAALSAYVLDMNPAGQYNDLTQQIEWYSTANEATVFTTLDEALVASGLTSFLGVTPTTTAVDLSSVGDSAQGQILQFTESAQSVYVATIGLTRAQASDFAIAISSSPLQASDVQSLAQAMATHLDAGVPAG
jgi:hypothetical protein